jgi:2-polyprenyl-3-methyl-5-hydroxy-6-metoxy-1,4-benzoquinol methylase
MIPLASNQVPLTQPSTVSSEEAQAFYEDFSLAVGERDWLQPNLRHEQLKLLIGQLLDGRRGLRIADVGCGAGTMTDYLTRFGSVVGIDFSRAAVDAASRCAAGPTFVPGGLEALPEGTYELITLFDVLEHIPRGDRPQFIAELRTRLAPGGLLFCSTPHPAFTRRRRQLSDPALQIIDEEVELGEVMAEAASAGLQLLNFSAYDVFAGSPEYQAMVFTPTLAPGGAPSLTSRRLRRRERLITQRNVRRLRRVWLAARAARHGRLRTAYWFLTASVPHVRS